MSDAVYLKCSCQKCDEHIEFPSDGIGLTINCPHCGEETILVSPPEKNLIELVVIIGGSTVILFVLVAAGVMFYVSKNLKPIAPVEIKTQAKTSAPALASPQSTELNGFKISEVTLKKTANSGLVYAVGTVKNDTPRQRFGVKIELDLLDAQTNKIGSASDYIAVLEPHKEWQFNALLTEPKAVQAKPANIEEQK